MDSNTQTHQCWTIRKIYIKQFFAETKCCLEALLGRLLIQINGKQESKESAQSEWFDDDPQSNTLQNSNFRPLTSYLSSQANKRKKTYLALLKKDEIRSDIIQWTPTHWHASVGRPAKIYIKQLSADTRYRLEDLPRAMAEKEWCVCMCVCVCVCVSVRREDPCCQYALMMMMMILIIIIINFLHQLKMMDYSIY